MLKGHSVGKVRTTETGTVEPAGGTLTEWTGHTIGRLLVSGAEVEGGMLAHSLSRKKMRS